MTTLKQLPALVVLERIPVPVLAIEHDGSILFTNSAFAAMVGFDPEEILSLRFHEIFHHAPASESPAPTESLLSVVHALATSYASLLLTFDPRKSTQDRRKLCNAKLERAQPPVYSTPCSHLVV